MSASIDPLENDHTKDQKTFSKAWNPRLSRYTRIETTRKKSKNDHRENTIDEQIAVA
jgi:hypothetical protein